jgi:hypothetical protein
MEKKGRKVYEERGPGEGGVIIILKCSRGSWGTHPSIARAEGEEGRRLRKFGEMKPRPLLAPKCHVFLVLQGTSNHSIP